MPYAIRSPGSEGTKHNIMKSNASHKNYDLSSRELAFVRANEFKSTV